MSDIAVVFDFDDTLGRDSMTGLLNEFDIDEQSFWMEEFPSRVKQGYDPTMASLSLLLEQFGPESQRGKLTRSKLEEVGTGLSEHLHDGVPGVFEDLHEIVREYDGVDLQFHVISEGLEPMIRSTEVAESCDEVYGSRVAYDEDGAVTRIKRAISFTDKTRYLFEINKGISSDTAREKPYEVNAKVESTNRAVPFESMIYIGDGITDIPCFSVVQDRGGRVFGIQRDPPSTKQRAILEELDSPQRAINVNEPDYTDRGQLGSLLRLTVEGMCTDMTIDGLEAL